jgi:molybdate transport system substrate-binding protein
MKHFAVLLLAVAGLACGRRDEGSTLRIAAAADLQFALDEGSREFRQSHPGITVAVTYGSSGNFYTQIRNGGPFDVFLSADQLYPARLVQDGVVKADAVFAYASGKIAVWVPSASELDPATAAGDPRLKHLAIANPQHAPYGRAAEAALRSLGVYDRVAPKLVLGENISQTLQFVESGAADAGIVALSLATAPAAREHGRFWEIPAPLYPKMVQSGVILRDAMASREFRDWLTGTEGRTLLVKYGFSLPDN